MIDHTVTPPGTWPRDLVVRTPTGMNAWVKRGEVLRCSPSPPEGGMASERTPAHTAIAAGKAVVSSTSSQHHWLRVSADGRLYRLQMSASNQRCHLQVSASDKQCLPRKSVNGSQPRFQAAVSSRAQLLHILAAAARISPLLCAQASNLPGPPQLPLVVTGELVKPRRRAFVARPAVKAANKHGLPLPR